MSKSQDRPPMWHEFRLGDLLREPLRNGHSARASTDGSGIRTLTLTAVTKGDFSEANTKVTAADPAKVRDLWLQPGDIFIERSNTPELVGTAGLYSGPPNYAVFPDLLIRVRVLSELSTQFVGVQLHAFEARRHFRTAAQGIAGTMPKISQGVIEALPIWLPPLPEQHRIVEAVDSYFSRLDDAVATLERVKRNLERYRASVLKAAVEGRLVPTEAELARTEGRDYEPASVLLDRILAERRRRWEEAELAKMEAKGKPPKNDGWKAGYEEPAAPDTTDRPELPEGWCWTSLDQLTCHVTSGSRGWAKYYAPEGPLFIRAQDLKYDRLDLKSSARVHLPGSVEGTRTRVEPNDLLITITGANVTKTGFVPTQIEEGYVSQHVGLCRLVRTNMVRYVHLWVIGPAGGRAHLERAAYGAGKPGLSLDNLKEVPVPLPPWAEAARIEQEVLRLLSTSDENSVVAATTIQRTRRLRQAVLNWAFEGKLADQDPTDEPAAALLERIRAERTKTTPKKTSDINRKQVATA